MNAAIVTAAAEQAAFSRVTPMPTNALEFMPEVRDMCGAGRCRQYGRNWMCPPGCGTLEECAAKAAGFGRGLLVQTVGTMEDDFDLEGIESAAQTHREHVRALHKSLNGMNSPFLLLGAGACDICPECTYPDAPCRFPELASPSMEAFGLFVSRVCALSDAPYYAGPGTITYTSCVLYNESDE